MLVLPIVAMLALSTTLAEAGERHVINQYISM
jgi:hypothetical protein